eukprot:m.1340734 g.1340734  ORF g.1340734 m.1340734 type:complete len:179 (-) comp24890_c1_seq32:3294-3830(-)
MLTLRQTQPRQCKLIPDFYRCPDTVGTVGMASDNGIEYSGRQSTCCRVGVCACVCTHRLRGWSRGGGVRVSSALRRAMKGTQGVLAPSRVGHGGLGERAGAGGVVGGVVGEAEGAGVARGVACVRDGAVVLHEREGAGEVQGPGLSEAPPARRRHKEAVPDVIVRLQHGYGQAALVAR